MCNKVCPLSLLVQNVGVLPTATIPRNVIGSNMERGQNTVSVWRCHDLICTQIICQNHLQFINWLSTALSCKPAHKEAVSVNTNTSYPNHRLYVYVCAAVCRCRSEDNCVSSFLLRSVPRVLSSRGQTRPHIPLCTKSSLWPHLLILNEIKLVTARTNSLGDMMTRVLPAICGRFIYLLGAGATILSLNYS